MSILIFIAFLYYAVAMVYIAIAYGPAIVFYIAEGLLKLPFMPFLVSNRIKKEKPFMAKALTTLWCLVWLIIAFGVLLYWATS